MKKRIIASAIAAIGLCLGFTPAQAQVQYTQYEMLLMLCHDGTVTPGMQEELNGLDKDQFVKFMKNCKLPMVGKGAVVKAPPVRRVVEVTPPPKVVTIPAPPVRRVVSDECSIWIEFVERGGVPATGTYPIEIDTIDRLFPPVRVYVKGPSAHVKVPCRIVESRLAKVCLGGARPGNPARFLKGDGVLVEARRIVASGGRVLNPHQPIRFTHDGGQRLRQRATHGSGEDYPTRYGARRHGSGNNMISSVVNGVVRGAVAVISPRPNYYMPPRQQHYRPQPYYAPRPMYAPRPYYGGSGYRGPVALIGPGPGRR